MKRSRTEGNLALLHSASAEGMPDPARFAWRELAMHYACQQATSGDESEGIGYDSDTLSRSRWKKDGALPALAAPLARGLAPLLGPPEPFDG